MDCSPPGSSVHGIHKDIRPLPVNFKTASAVDQCKMFKNVHLTIHEMCSLLQFKVQNQDRSETCQGERPARQDREHLTESHLELLLEPMGLRHMWDKRLPRLAELLTWKVAWLSL